MMTSRPSRAANRWPEGLYLTWEMDRQLMVLKWGVAKAEEMKDKAPDVPTQRLLCK